MYKKSKIAFTLAEVLLVLTIVGIIVGTLIPVLMANVQQQEHIAQAHKAFASLSSAWLNALRENGGSNWGEWGYNKTSAYDAYNAIKAQYKVIRDCPYGTGNFGKCWSSDGVGQIGTITSGQTYFSNTTNYQNMNPSFVTADGMFIMLYAESSTLAGTEFAVDVNGFKGPNDWGDDVFIFGYSDDKLAYAGPATPSGYGVQVKRNGQTFDWDSIYKTIFGTPSFKG